MQRHVIIRLNSQITVYSYTACQFPYCQIMCICLIAHSGSLVPRFTLKSHQSYIILLFQIKNPTFIFVSLGGCTESLIIFGVSAFSFKYLLEMYSLPFDQAGYLLGKRNPVLFIYMFLNG